MKKIIKFSILLLLLFEVRFFYIINLPLNLDDFNTYWDKTLIASMAIFITLVIFIFRKSIEKSRPAIQSLFLTIIWAIEVISTSLRYNQGLMSSFRGSNFLLMILLYFILSYFLKSEEDYNYFNNIIATISLITSSVFCIQAFIYNSGGALFLKIYELGNSIPMRNNTIRLTQPSTIISFAIIISFSRIMKKKYSSNIIKMIDIFNVVISLIYLEYVCQTRALLLAVIGSMVFMLFAKPLKRKKLKPLYMMLLVFLLILLITSSFAGEFYQSFSNASDAGSVFARQEAISYYGDLFLNSPILGFGVINAAENNQLFYILHGKQGYLNSTDIGILGFIFQYGIVGFIWIFSVLLSFIKIIYTIYKKRSIKTYLETIGIMSYIVFTLPTLVITNSQRFILLPMSMAIFDYCYKSYQVKRDWEIKGRRTL